MCLSKNITVGGYTSTVFLGKSHSNVLHAARGSTAVGVTVPYAGSLGCVALRVIFQMFWLYLML